MKTISDKTLGVVLMIFSSFGLILGLLAIFDIVSSKYVWGGRATDHNQLIILETVTFIVNGLILWLIAMRVNFAKQKISTKTLNILFIILSIMMALNTIGNIFAKTSAEKFMAIPTLIGAIGFYVLARRKSPR